LNTSEPTDSPIEMATEDDWHWLVDLVVERLWQTGGLAETSGDPHVSSGERGSS